MPAENRAIKTQKQWISYFNQKGIAMIGAPDVYNLAKGPKDVLQSFRKDCIGASVLTSTGMDCNSNDLSGAVIQNMGSAIVKQKITKLSIIPVFHFGISLYYALKTNDGLTYMRAIFDTKDNRKQITKTLEDLSQKEADKIAIWTPNKDLRANYSMCAIRFFYCAEMSNKFCIYGDSSSLDIGRSLGVSYDPKAITYKKI